jgi:hypothetical protein
MRVATIILPTHDNDGKALEYARNDAKRGIVNHFNGLTSVMGHGSWKGGEGRVYNEPVEIISVAMVDTSENRAKLTAIAQRFALLGDQYCVYVQYADGHVVFVEKPRIEALEQPAGRAPEPMQAV